MRQLALILSIFILTLSTVPCSDGMDCNEQGVDLNDDHTNHEHNEDTCTPFCSCACCGIAGIVLSAPKLFVISQEGYNYTTFITQYNSDFISSYFYSFWQPPKLS